MPGVREHVVQYLAVDCVSANTDIITTYSIHIVSANPITTAIRNTIHYTAASAQHGGGAQHDGGRHTLSVSRPCLSEDTGLSFCRVHCLPQLRCKGEWVHLDSRHSPWASNDRER